ncbi:peptidase S24/S26A/S26B/S26C [Lactarius hatsudake]|nr:peptidase S24/S26A/S26B/S26C [Lactarius hatsudake]
MQPTLNPDPSRPRDVALFNRWSIVMKRRYERGDVVAFRSPQEHGKLLVKRLVALPGDKVVRPTKVKTLPPYPDVEVVVPEGHGWLEGDASFNSEDSNHFGPVPLALIDSKLIVQLFGPQSDSGAITSHTTGTQSERVVSLTAFLKFLISFYETNFPQHHRELSLLECHCLVCNGHRCIQPFFTTWT